MSRMCGCWCRGTITGTFEWALWLREVRRKDWITDDIWKAIEEGRVIKHSNRASEGIEKKKLAQEYKQKNNAVKKKIK